MELEVQNRLYQGGCRFRKIDKDIYFGFCHSKLKDDQPVYLLIISFFLIVKGILPLCHSEQREESII
jgi:hypothetical protein